MSSRISSGKDRKFYWVVAASVLTRTVIFLNTRRQPSVTSCARDWENSRRRRPGRETATPNRGSSGELGHGDDVARVERAEHMLELGPVGHCRARHRWQLQGGGYGQRSSILARDPV